MRDILFRGKRKDNGEWVEGYVVHQTDFYGDKVDRYFIIDGTETNDYDIGPAYEVIPETVGQYTGLKDKNGTKIFEGDILSGLFLFGMEVKAVCAFRDGAFGALWQRGNIEVFNAFTSVCNVKWEILGNTHDNPELMEKANG
ncbi:MAG: hypothetical protein J1G06_08625 [Oscillospiraceae bacterium]|nr:hypothetical protein [Oscillospiraceae bacterium]